VDRFEDQRGSGFWGHGCLRILPRYSIARVHFKRK
jgi:hypothetical protein